MVRGGGGGGIENWQNDVYNNAINDNLVMGKKGGGWLSHNETQIFEFIFRFHGSGGFHVGTRLYYNWTVRNAAD